MQYKVRVAETTAYTYTVEAVSARDAIDHAEDLHSRGQTSLASREWSSDDPVVVGVTDEATT